MRLGILSDTHNNAPNTTAALDIFRREGVTRIVHCGDVTGGSLLALFQGWDAIFVRGNMDRELAGLEAAAGHYGLSAPQPSYQLLVDGFSLYVLHGHVDLDRLIRGQDWHYVLHGHTHRRRDEQIGRTRVINPGALGGAHFQSRSIAILDVAAGDLRFIELPGG